MTIRPLHRLETLEARIYRPALGAFVRALAEKGYYSIDDCAALAQHIEGRSFPPLVSGFANRVLPSNFANLYSMDLPLLKLYGSLGEAERRRLLNGDAIGLPELSSEQQAVTVDYIYSEARLDVSIEFANEDWNTAQARGEAAEVFPDGLSSADSLKMQVDSEPGYLVKLSGDNGVQYTQSLSLPAIAEFASFSGTAPDGHTLDILSIQPSQKRTVSIAFTVSGVPVVGALSEEFKTAGGPWTLDTLPDDLKQQLVRLRPPGQPSSPPPSNLPPPRC